MCGIKLVVDHTHRPLFYHTHQFHCYYISLLFFIKCEDLVFTSATIGTLDGNGETWWGFPGIGYLLRTENRPRMLVLDHNKNILIENLLFKQPPYWTFLASQVDGLEIRFCEISARRNNKDGHDLWNITAFNTDGFDVTGALL